jgi:multidrug efflux pump subunit AcrA (membrane-fusion protein)
VKTDTVRVEGWVNVADALLLKPGDRVRVRIDPEWLPGLSEAARKRVFEGKIGFIDVTVNPVNKQIRVWAEVPNEKNLLKAGLFTLMEITPAGDTETADAAGARK